MASASFCLVFPIIFNTIYCSSLTQQKLVVNLIHRDSKLSPFYDANATIWELRQRAIDRSFQRAAYLSTALTTSQKRLDGSDEVIGIGLHPIHDGSGVFLANLSFGQPPVLQTLIVDTGSDITWIRCAPCPDCGRQTGQLFDPDRSRGYKRLPCRKGCRQFGGNPCNWLSENNCTFNLTYADGNNASGDLATEQLYFPTISGDTDAIEIDGIGCAHSVSMPHSAALGGTSGILALGPSSLVNQIGGKFSYCLGNVIDPNYALSWLVLGQGANLEGDRLRAFIYAGHLLVIMKGISVGNELLNIDPIVFIPSDGDSEGGVLFDTGSTLTYLVEPAYNVLRDKVRSLVSNILTPAYHPQFLCYVGRVDREVSDFPYVRFHFEGGVDLVLGPRSFFWQVGPELVCMAVTSTRRLNIIGAMAQQDYNIGFDNRGIVYIQSIDCSLYFDH